MPTAFAEIGPAAFVALMMENSMSMTGVIGVGGWATAIGSTGEGNAPRSSS